MKAIVQARVNKSKEKHKSWAGKYKKKNTERGASVKETDEQIKARLEQGRAPT